MALSDAGFSVVLIQGSAAKVWASHLGRNNGSREYLFTSIRRRAPLLASEHVSHFCAPFPFYTVDKTLGSDTFRNFIGSRFM